MKSENHIVKLSLHIDVLLLKIKKHFVKEQENKNTLKEDGVRYKFEGVYEARTKMSRKKATCSVCVCLGTYFLIPSFNNSKPLHKSHYKPGTLVATLDINTFKTQETP